MSKWVIFFKWQLLFWVTVLHYTYQDMQETTVFKFSFCSWFLARNQPVQFYLWAIPCSSPEIIFPGMHVTLSGGSDSGSLQKVGSGKEGCCFQWPAWLADRIAESWKWNWHPTGICNSTSVQGKKGKVKEMVIVTIPMDYRFGLKNLGIQRINCTCPCRETITKRKW